MVNNYVAKFHFATYCFTHGFFFSVFFPSVFFSSVFFSLCQRFGPYLCNQWRFSHQIWNVGTTQRQYYAKLKWRSSVKGQGHASRKSIFFFTFWTISWQFMYQILPNLKCRLPLGYNTKYQIMKVIRQRWRSTFIIESNTKTKKLLDLVTKSLQVRTWK